jgi:hypothetical protein
MFMGLLALLIKGLAFYTGTRFKDWITPSKWKSVFVALLKKLLKNMDGAEATFVEPHEVEQYHFRMLMCEPCVETNKCINCGCDTMAKMNVRREQCSKGRWGKFKSAEEWELYKQQHNIYFELFIKGVKAKDLDI